ncbi:hypothetical protein GQ53DRAFT_837040 [Thozetella sp. PMI_491]|nr:hypothetical protein GQ53DRAFT_837040 [Thozetella sp. PMI_491]
MEDTELQPENLFNCVAESRFKFWSSKESGATDSEKWHIGDDVLSAKLANAKKDPSVTLVTTVGDPMYRRKPLQLTCPALVSLLKEMGALRFYSYMVALETYNLSHHVQFEGKSPVALVLLLRIPRNSLSINIAVRIELETMSSICFLAAAKEDVAEYLHRRCVEEREMLAQHPLYLLALVLEERFTTYKRWEIVLHSRVGQMETVTGMGHPLWKSTVSEAKIEWLSDSNNRMKYLHQTSTEIHHLGNVLEFGRKFGQFCLSSAKMLKDLRSQCLPPTSDVDTGPAHFAYDEHVKFFLGRMELTERKVQEVTERLQAQIAVVMSLISQRDSNINLAIAEDSNRVATLAARDSETMKTITFLTLLFLPASLVASVWSAGIFHLDDETNWKAYVGTTVLLTTSVFCAWAAYVRLRGSERRAPQPLHIAGVGYVREGKLVQRTMSHLGQEKEDEGPEDMSLKDISAAFTDPPGLPEARSAGYKG